MALWKQQLLPGSDFLHHSNALTVRLCFVEFDGKSAMEGTKSS